MNGTPQIGLIGLGLLGSAIAERLQVRGFRVIGFDQDPSRRVVAQVADDACGVVRSCDRIILSLPTSDVVASVVDRIEPSLRPGQTLIDTTTGDPSATIAMGARLSALGVAYLDATVSGSSEQARHGNVVIMAGGDSRAFSKCRDVFDRLARATFHVGPVGSGAKMKLASNLVLGLNRAALAEGLAFARASGLDPALTLAVLREGAAYSRIMDSKGPKMISGDFTPEARLSQHLKDVLLILAEARANGAWAPLSDVHRALLEKAEAAGFGLADNSAVIRAFDTPRPTGPSPEHANTP